MQNTNLEDEIKTLLFQLSDFSNPWFQIHGSCYFEIGIERQLSIGSCFVFSFSGAFAPSFPGNLYLFMLFIEENILFAYPSNWAGRAKKKKKTPKKKKGKNRTEKFSFFFFDLGLGDSRRMILRTCLSLDQSRVRIGLLNPIEIYRPASFETLQVFFLFFFY